MVDMAQTSIDAYMKKLSEGSLGRDQSRVLKKVANFGPITCKDVAGLMGKHPNEISGRFTELRKEGWIKIVGREDGHRLYEAVE